MNPHVTDHLAQAHTADLVREAERQRLADATERRPRRSRAAIRRILSSVLRGSIRSTPTATTTHEGC
jgi:hypothetical protein